MFLLSIDWLAFCACLLVIFFGRGPKRVFALSAYILLSYLWGFVWRSGGEIDAVFVPFQVALVYCFFREPEALTLSRRSDAGTLSPENGWFFSMVLLVFIGNYFYSGINKIVDIPIWEWFQYDLVGEIAQEGDKIAAGYYASVLPGVQFARNWTFLNPIIVPFAYFMELSIPVIYFWRRLIPVYMLYFIFFHIMTWAVAILFFGNILVWFCLLPVQRIFLPRARA